MEYIGWVIGIIIGLIIIGLFIPEEGKKDKVKTNIFVLVLLVLFAWYVIPSEKEERASAKEKISTQRNSKISSFKNLAGYYDLKEISKAYTQEHNMSEYSNMLYNCLGELVWEKNEDFTIQKMIDWCMIDYKKGIKKAYYNTAELMSGFSGWDGSYKRLEDVIKNNMNDPESYEHVQTTHRFVYYGTKRPHMIVSTKYRGKNAYGAVVLGAATAKIDALTYEGYDIDIK